MSTEKWDAMWEKVIRYMRFAVKLYRLQIDSGRLFIHEHPSTASSWKMHGMVKLMEDININIEKVVGHMCRYGMESKDDQGTGLVKKATGFSTNSPFVRNELVKKCMGGHRHVALMGGRAEAFKNYPNKLCRAMLRGIQSELVHSGMLKGEDSDMRMVRCNDED